MKFQLALAMTAMMAAPAFADGHAATAAPTGDAAAGEKAFKRCVSCHVVVDDAGETLAGKKAKTGPNLYGIAAGPAGQVDFKYSKILMTAAEAGLVMDEDAFVGYVMDPSAYLSEVAGEKGRSKMTFKLKKEDDARNIYAFLFSLQPAPEATAEGTEASN